MPLPIEVPCPDCPAGAKEPCLTPGGDRSPSEHAARAQLARETPDRFAVRWIHPSRPLDVACPECPAEAGEPCQRTKGPGPHQRRVQAALRGYLVQARVRRRADRELAQERSQEQRCPTCGQAVA